MPIEFRCTKCGKLLRVPDDTAGKQARCPECGTILGIPAGLQPSVPPAAAPQAAPRPAASVAPIAPQVASAEMFGRGPDRAAAEGANPYQSPVSGSRTADAASTGHGKLAVGDALSRAWTIYAANMGSCIGIVLLNMVMNFVSAMGLGVCIFGVAMVFGIAVGRAGGAGPTVGLIGMIVVIGFMYLVMFVVQLYFLAGQTNFFLKVSRGDRDADVTKLFSGLRWVLPALGAFILYLIAVMIGSVLLIVPGILVGLILSQFLFLIIDRNLGIFAAFRESYRITSGNKGMLFLTIFLPGIAIWLLLAVVGILLPTLMPKLALVFAGVQLLLQLLLAIFVIPWFSVLWAVCYLIMSGQRTADQIVATPEPGLTSAV